MAAPLPNRWAFETYGHLSGSPVVSTAVPNELRNLITTCGVWNGVSELAQSLVETQLKAYREHKADVERRSHAANTTLFESVATKIAESIGDDPEEDVKAILSLPTVVVVRRFIPTHSTMRLT